jgi:sugar fermentation stimulation protein A
MHFKSPLARGKLIKRYKRFLADVLLETGETVTAACPNTGSMLGLTEVGNCVWLSRSESPTRKYPHTWELVVIPDIGLVGINTAQPNHIVTEAITRGKVAGLEGYATLRNEVKYGQNSRIDVLLEDAARPPCYVEIKNVHFFRKPGLAEFPDCVTERGTKHLVELSNMVKAGARAVMVYLIQCQNPSRFALADDKDRTYFNEFRRARDAGVEALALTCYVSTSEITVDRAIPVMEMR